MPDYIARLPNWVQCREARTGFWVIYTRVGDRKLSVHVRNAADVERGILLLRRFKDRVRPEQ